MFREHKTRWFSSSVRKWRAGIFFACWVTPALGNIDLEFRTTTPVVAVGDIVEVGLYLTSDDETEQGFSAVQLIVEWDPAVLELIGLTEAGAVPGFLSGFLNEPFGVNEADLPIDGLGLYTFLSPLPPQTTTAAPEGTLLTTLRFLAVAPTAETIVDVVESLEVPAWLIESTVYKAGYANYPVTGELIGANIAITKPQSTRRAIWEAKRAR